VPCDRQSREEIFRGAKALNRATSGGAVAFTLPVDWVLDGQQEPPSAIHDVKE
jgi:hypothetical protein